MENMFNLNNVSKKTVDTAKRIEKQTSEYLTEKYAELKKAEEEKLTEETNQIMSSARFGFASSIAKSKDRVRALSEEIKYTNEATTIAMTEMVSQIVEASLLLDEEEYVALNPLYKDDIRETVRGFLENAEIQTVTNPDMLTIMEYVSSKLPAANEGKYLTEDDIFALMKAEKPAVVEAAIRNLSGNVSKRVATLVEKEQKKVSKIQKDLEQVVPAEKVSEKEAEVVAEAPLEEDPTEGAPAPAEQVPGKQIHINPDGTASVATPNGEIAINPDGSMDIQLMEALIEEAFTEELNEEYLNEFNVDRYANKTARKLADKQAGKKKGPGPLLLFLFGSMLGGVIWAIIRGVNNYKKNDKAQVLYDAIMSSPKCRSIVKRIEMEVTKENPNKETLRSLKKELKDTMKDEIAEVKLGNSKNFSRQYVLAENTLIRETPRCGLLESLAVNEAVEMLSEGKEYNGDLCLANAVMFMTITEAMGETGLMKVDDLAYSKIIANAGGSLNEGNFRLKHLQNKKIKLQTKLAKIEADLAAESAKKGIPVETALKTAPLKESCVTVWGVQQNKTQSTDLAEKIRQKRLLEEKSRSNKNIND